MIAMLRKIREHWGDKELEFFKEDWQAGFRQLPILSEHKRYFVAAAAQPNGDIVCFVPKAMLFGPPRCPPQFCRASEALERVAAGLLWIVTTHHVDDHIIVDEPQYIHSARQAFRKLASILQIKLSDEKSLPKWCSICSDHDSMGNPVCAECGSCHSCSPDQTHTCSNKPSAGTTEGPALGPILRLPDAKQRSSQIVACLLASGRGAHKQVPR